MLPDSNNDRPEPGERPPQAVGCGCTLPGHGLLLLALTITFATLLASRDDLRGSLLWLVLIPLIAGMVLLFVRVRRYRRP